MTYKRAYVRAHHTPFGATFSKEIIPHRQYLQLKMLRLDLLFVLLFAVGVAVGETIEGLEEDEADEEAQDVYPLRGLKARRNLDYCQTHHNPCKNGGYCCSGPGCGTTSAKYTCRCKSPYSGTHCEHECPIKACWSAFYNKAYNNGHKRSLTNEACKGHVEVLGQCLSSAVQSREACHCDLKDIESAKSFEENGKESLISRQCGGSHKCDDARVQQCLRKIYRVGGAIDSTKQRTEKERCSLVDEAVSCMEALAGSDFAGCPTNKKMFTEKVGIRQAQWRTWCMGKYCSLYGCGEVKVPGECSEASMVSSIKPVMGCMKDKLEKCVPSMMDKLKDEMREMESELRKTILEKCEIKKEVSGKCGSNKRVLEARELLRALLEGSLED